MVAPAAPAPVAPVSLPPRGMVLPEPGERVIEVPQLEYRLMALAGQPAAAIAPFVGSSYHQPRWVSYNRQIHPGWGCGLLLVRDGLLCRGPERWDSS